jgi:hypothetical protein
MKLTLRDLLHWDGKVGRGVYALVGLIGFAIKHNLDRFVAGHFFAREWGILSYWVPLDELLSFSVLSDQARAFLFTMAALALPFVWIGVVMTLKRLRSAGLPLWLVALFFVPGLNLAFFIWLSTVPPREPETPSEFSQRLYTGLGRCIPQRGWGRAALALLLSALFGCLLIWLSLAVLLPYAYSLFLALPFCMGLLASLIYGYHHPQTAIACATMGMSSVLFLALLLLAWAMEGIICLLMAAPLAFPLAGLGGLMAHSILSRSWLRRQSPEIMAAFLLALGGVGALEPLLLPNVPVFAVTSALEVAAPPERVWKNVISFPELPAPAEWHFRRGIAYPVRARIEGAGPGAMRFCEFSTGAFVEPIEIWEAPTRLKFSVVKNPAPMREWNPFAEVHTPHLDGFLVSRAGEFRLVRLPDGRTRLEGTTWYQHNLWPAAYWRVWSDAIIHRIHLRVLTHIQRLSEEIRPETAEVGDVADN